eukprot:3005455-Prymnesium_polylepis.1
MRTQDDDDVCSPLVRQTGDPLHVEWTMMIGVVWPVHAWGVGAYLGPACAVVVRDDASCARDAGEA